MSLGQIKIFLILACLLYFLWPWDFIPDVLGLFGRIDEVLLFAYALRWYWKKKLKEYQEQIKREQAAEDKAKGAPQEPLNDESPFDPYEILGVARDAEDEELKAAYRRETAKYHPDKVTHLGAELQELAHQRTLLIQRAYKQLKPNG